MGAELYAKDPVYRATFDQCAEIAGKVHGRSLVDCVFGKPMAESHHYNDLEETNLVLLAQGYATAQSLLARKVYPDALVGYSLGELIAATVAQVITLEDALALTRAHARHVMNRVPTAAMVADTGFAQFDIGKAHDWLPWVKLVASIQANHFVMTVAL